jgi:hypothetical protein
LRAPGASGLRRRLERRFFVCLLPVGKTKGAGGARLGSEADFLAGVLVRRHVLKVQYCLGWASGTERCLASMQAKKKVGFQIEDAVSECAADVGGGFDIVLH